MHFSLSFNADVVSVYLITLILRANTETQYTYLY